MVTSKFDRSFGNDLPVVSIFGLGFGEHHSLTGSLESTTANLWLSKGKKGRGWGLWALAVLRPAVVVPVLGSLRSLRRRQSPPAAPAAAAAAAEGFRVRQSLCGAPVRAYESPPRPVVGAYQRPPSEPL